MLLVWNYYRSPIGQWQYFVSNSQITRNTSAISKINEPIPSYYFADDYLTNKLSSINTNNRFRHGVTFNFITDMHYPRNTGNSKLLLKRVCDKTSVKNTFFGGDNVYLVHGHTPVDEPTKYCENHKIDIDIGAIFNNRLAILDLNTLQAKIIKG